MGFRVGVDVGGTFTDFLVVDERGSPEIFKTSTTPRDPTIGFFRGLEKAATARGLTLAQFLDRVDTVVHGTTITTNATLTGDGAVTGFVTTKGFRDVLNMRRGLKERQYDKYAPPATLVPRHRIRVVEERVNVAGEVVTPLNEQDVREAARYFRAQGVEAVAVSLLWSFLHPQHEERIRAIIEEEMPGIYVSLSTEILPQIRVYERHSTTALNAYVGPVLTRYLKRLQEELQKRRFKGKLLIMQSNGGVMSPEVAQRFASNTLLSGPAGAPMAGVFYGGTQGFRNVITVDMGGTSFDVALVKDAQPTITNEGIIDGHRIASPILDIHTIGAGGGSIAWVDSGGMLAVGPKSAGAEPGPACYGRGGTKPTVTDAQYLLGYLDPSLFEAGEIDFDRDASWRAVKENVADPLKLDMIAAAAGIYDIVNSNMAAALGVVSVQRGYDPREFVLVVAGGAGPIHAAPIARELQIPLILIPRASSVFCAAGMLISDLKHDFVRTYAREFAQVKQADVRKLYAEMAAAGKATLKTEHVPASRIEIDYTADVRYVGQFNEVEVPVPSNGRIDAAALEAIAEEFHNRHDSLYGYSMRGAALELINLRITARGRTDKPQQEKLRRKGSGSAHARIGKRKAFFDGRFLEVSVYDGLALQAGNRVPGPAIVVQPTTSIVLPPDFDFLCDDYGNYLMFGKGQDVAKLCKSLR
ncbi:MAG: hydantoinase/oxoprolinase family protein [Gammaproteobacteria bacterium]